LKDIHTTGIQTVRVKPAVSNMQRLVNKLLIAK